MTFQQATIAVIITVLLSFLLKGITAWHRGEGFRPFSLGGMPSAHGTVVGSAAAIAFLETGWSVLLIITVLFGFLVLRDSYGVRWEVTRHSEALNRLTRSKRFIRTGHTRVQVLAGAILGVVAVFVAYALM